MRHIRRVSVLLLALVPGATLSAQSTWNNPKFRDAVGAAAKPVLQAVCDQGSEQERRICAEVEFRITVGAAEISLNPKSVPSPGQRITNIPDLWMRQFLMTNEAMVIEHYLNKPGFMREYVLYVASQRDPNAVKFPSEYANLTPEQAARLQKDAESASQRIIFQGGLVFLIAHEFAHQLETPDPPGTPFDCVSQQQKESAADEKAIKYMLALGEPPVGGVPTLLFDYYTNEEAQSKDHTRPFEAQRIRRLEQATLDRLSDFRDLIAKRGQDFEQVKASLTNGVRKLDAEIASLPLGMCLPTR
jgi:hypothetical protein